MVDAAMVGLITALHGASGGTPTDLNSIVNAVNNKADKSYVNTELDKKADSADVDTKLSKKADANSVTQLEENLDAISARQNILTGSATGVSVSISDALAAPFIGLRVWGKSTQNGTPTPTAPVPIVSAGDGGTVVVTVSDGANESQTLTLQTPNALPGIPVTSGGNYTDENGQQWVCDEVDLARGVRVQHITKIKLTSAMGWQTANSKRVDRYFASFKGIDMAGILCTHFSFSTGAEVVGGMSANLGNIGFAYAEKGTTTVSDFKSFLDANDVYVWAALATPVETALSAAEIAAYKALTTYAPTTVISVSGGAIADVTYQQDANIMLNKKADADAVTAFINAAPAATLEKAIEAYYAMCRTGRIYGVRVPKFASNPTTTCTRLGDAVDMAYAPSTDTVKGQDDFIDKIPMFDWVHVNYVRDDDGAPRPIAIEGMSNYKVSGAVDIGAMQIGFFWKAVDNEDSVDYYVSDTQHDGFVPWSECVKADGTVLPWCIGSAYLSGTASDGLLRSQPGLAIALYQSYNNMITNYQKKGAGYWGAGAERNSFGILMQLIKTANKPSQATWAGCTNYNFQYTAAIERTTNEKYFPVTKTQAASLVVGSAVYVGYGENKNGAVNNDRGIATMRAYADLARITKIKDLDDANSAVYLDVVEGFPTAKVTLTDTLQSPIYLSTMPWWAGTTDKVIGKYDGSWLSNTNGKMPYRIQGREYNVGCYEVASDTVLDCHNLDGNDILVAPHGVKHSTADATIRSTYTKVGMMPGVTVAADQNVGDVAIDTTTGAWYVSAYGGSATQGMGDRTYGIGSQSGMREYLQRGALGAGSLAGCSFLYCWSWLGWAYWYFGAGD